jgi:excisionase family DNA binding protein
VHTVTSWLSLAAVAVRLGVSVSTLNRWIADGIGPPSFLIGRSRRFDESELETWLHEQRATQ